MVSNVFGVGTVDEICAKKWDVHDMHMRTGAPEEIAKLIDEQIVNDVCDMFACDNLDGQDKAKTVLRIHNENR